MALRSGVLVLLQIALIAALVPPWTSGGFQRWALVPLVLSALLGIWTLSANRPGNFSVFPEPRPTARLITSGPYRFVRHPMYLAVLLFGAGFAAGWSTLAHLMLLAGLAGVLHVKADVEEAAMLARFPAYRDYWARTPRILPFVRWP